MRMTDPARLACVWVSEWGFIDIRNFSHLKFRKDGEFDGRRKDAYYKELKEYVYQKEDELIKEWRIRKE